MTLRKEDLSFWRWFFRGSGGRAGFRRLLSVWMLADIGVGLLIAFLVDRPLQSVAQDMIFPASGIFIGIALAWAGNMSAIVLSQETVELSKRNRGGIQNYVFPFQLGMLVFLIVFIIWSLLSFGINPITKTHHVSLGYVTFETACYATASLAIRTTWQVISLVSKNVITMVYIRKEA